MDFQMGQTSYSANAQNSNYQITEQAGMDKRARRIQMGRLFSKGVTDFRTRLSQRPVTEHTARSQHTKVFVRARPLFEHEHERGEWECITADDNAVVVHEASELVKRGTGGRQTTLQHHDFPGLKAITTDEEGYNKLQYLAEGAAAGQLATLFIYGMTGSGKTYSTNLLHEGCPAELLKEEGSEVELIAYELIGKRAFDLLGPDKHEVHLRVGEDGNTHVHGSTSQHAAEPAQLTALLKAASANRETAATGTNATSSRSHAVYQLRCSSGGSLTIIDLAGNEGNIETFNHSREQMAEAAEINMSLMALKNCLQARTLKQARIPYRESVLTRVLREALTRKDALTACLCCVSPACSHMEHSLNTLKTAWCLMGDKPKPKPERQELREAGIRMGGPTKWSNEDLVSWLADQKFAKSVTIAAGVNGSAIMKLTAPRLACMCDGNQEVAKVLFAGLREAAKQAAVTDRQARAELKAEKEGKPTTAINFSKSAPSKPVVAKRKPANRKPGGVSPKMPDVAPAAEAAASEREVREAAPAAPAVFALHLVKVGGPSKWSHDELVAWVTEQEYSEAVSIPEGVNGSAIMKLTALRLASICDGDQEVAKVLFAGLREAAKQAATRDRQARAERHSSKLVQPSAKKTQEPLVFRINGDNAKFNPDAF